MKYQVRHIGKEPMGIYQGEFIGMGFWHPISEMPEQGLCEFLNREAAEDFINWFCKEAVGKFKRSEFVVEPFDEKLNLEMQLADMEEVQ